MVRMFANGPGDHGAIHGRVIPKTQKAVLDSFLLYKVHIKGKWSKWSNPGIEEMPSLYLGVVAIEKGAFRSPWRRSTNLNSNT